MLTFAAAAAAAATAAYPDPVDLSIPDEEMRNNIAKTEQQSGLPCWRSRLYFASPVPNSGIDSFDVEGVGASRMRVLPRGELVSHSLKK